MSDQLACVLDHGSDANGSIRKQADVGFLCGWHRGRMTTTTGHITQLWYDLAFIVEAGTAPKDETPKTRHLKSAEAPAPANLDVLALRDPRTHPARIAVNPDIPKHEGDLSTPIPPVLTVVAGWLLCLAEERPLTATVLPKSVVAQLALLERHHDWIAAQAWVDDYVAEMGELYRALRAAVRDQVTKRIGVCRLPVEGGVCGGTLLEENGTGVIRCASCSARWVTPQEQARLAVTLESA